MIMNPENRNSISTLARRLCVFLILGCLSCSAMGTNAKEEPTPPTFKVGYRVLDLGYKQGEGRTTITVAVWYPTAISPKRHNYGGPTEGTVAVDAAPLATSGPYPMLVFSHGYSGSGIGSAFFTEALAARGWIVVAPDHHDRHASLRIRSGQLEDIDRKGLLQHAREIAASCPEDRSKFLYRLDEIKHVIDQIIVSEAFRDFIDTDRIAVGGHSFGGYTALGLCGTLKERHDPRIKAVLLFSTGAGGYLFTKEELSAVTIPAMLLMGELEKKDQRGAQTMDQLEEKIYRAMSPPKYFLEIKGARHGSFNNRFSDNLGARLLSGTEEQFEVIRRYSIAFLEKHVAGRKNSVHVLERGDPLLTRYVMEPVPDASKHDLAAPGNRIGGVDPDAPADAGKARR